MSDLAKILGWTIAGTVVVAMIDRGSQTSGVISNITGGWSSILSAITGGASGGAGASGQSASNTAPAVPPTGQNG